jgi:hypothetical protein
MSKTPDKKPNDDPHPKADANQGKGLLSRYFGWWISGGIFQPIYKALWDQTGLGGSYKPWLIGAGVLLAMFLLLILLSLIRR